LNIQYFSSQIFGDLKKLWDENFNISKNIKLGLSFMLWYGEGV
jgi:hypothetical protein